MTEETKPTKQDLIAILDDLVAGMENLPPHALVMPITHYDHWQLMILISQIFKSENKS